MGGGQTKAAEYVLRCVDEADASLLSAPSPSRKVSVSSSGKGGVAAAAVAAAAASSAGTGSDPASTSAHLIRVSSPEGLPPPGSLQEHSPNLRQQSSRKLSTQKSMAQLAAQPSAPSSSSARKVVGGQKFPWILKAVTPGITSMSQVEPERVIGTGFMGSVRLARLQGKGGYFALKAVRKDYIIKHRDQGHIENERSCLLLSSSPFCVRCFGTFQDGGYVYFAMELAAGGELFRRISKKGGFPEQEAKFYLTEIFSALDHLHTLGYVYRDLKPENVMLDEDGHCKLVDFGFATRPDANGIIRTLCGTPAYLSPEQLNGKFTNGYSKACDWWSLGIILYELMTGKTPFCKNFKESSYEIYLRILKVKISFPRTFGKESRELVQSLCHANIDRRLVDQGLIRAHPYFTAPWDKVERRLLVPPFVPRLKDEADRDHYFRRYPPHKDIEGTEGRLDLEGF